MKNCSTCRYWKDNSPEYKPFERGWKQCLLANYEDDYETSIDDFADKQKTTMLGFGTEHRAGLQTKGCHYCSLYEPKE